MKAVWAGRVICSSDETVVVEGNHYFPLSALDRDCVRESSETTFCPWKGTASYLDVVVGDDVNAASAWYYTDPKPEAEAVRDRVAFWKGIEVVPG